MTKIPKSADMLTKKKYKKVPKNTLEYFEARD